VHSLGFVHRKNVFATRLELQILSDINCIYILIDILVQNFFGLSLTDYWSQSASLLSSFCNSLPLKKLLDTDFIACGCVSSQSPTVFVETNCCELGFFWRLASLEKRVKKL